MGKIATAALLLTCLQAHAADTERVSVNLQAKAGIPLRLYTTKRFTKRAGDLVHAKLLEPVFSFNREIIPAGSIVEGRVRRTTPIRGFQRTSAIVAGDFTPLRNADVEFTSVTLPDGKQIGLHTTDTSGLNTLYKPVKPGAKAPAGTSISQRMKDRIHAQAQSVAEEVRGPDKMERLQQVFVNKLPWHPQWVRKGTRFDAELSEPIAFGTESFEPGDLRMLGSQPTADSVIHARLLTPLSSLGAKKGQPVEAVLSQPLLENNLMVLPEGTTLSGQVTLGHRARWFRRGGQLRFAFEKVSLPEDSPRALNAIPSTDRIPAVLDAAESGGTTDVKIDKEGGAKAVESKTRLIGPILAGMIAARTMDRDRDRRGELESNRGGRTLGGGSGFGLLGSIAAQTSRTTGRVLGFYGLAWSVYNSLIARGAEVEFRKDAALDIRFGTRAASK